MTPQDKTLVKKRTVAVLLVFGWGWVREQQVPVDADAAALQLLGAQVGKTKE